MHLCMCCKRDHISDLMLQVDEAWISHQARLRHRPYVTPYDVQAEEALFNLEAVLLAADSRIRRDQVRQT